MPVGRRRGAGAISFGWRPIHILLIAAIAVLSAALVIVTMTSEAARRAELRDLLASETATMNVFSTQAEAQTLATATERYLAGSTPRRNVQIARATLANRLQIRSAITGVNPAATDAKFLAALDAWDTAFADPPVGPLTGKQRELWVSRLSPANSALEVQARQIVSRSVIEIRSDFEGVATSAAAASRLVRILTAITFLLAVLTALLLTRHIRGTYRFAGNLIEQEKVELSKARDALDAASALDREQASILEMVATGAPLKQVLERIAALVSSHSGRRSVILEADGLSVMSRPETQSAPATSEEPMETLLFGSHEDPPFDGRMDVSSDPALPLTEADMEICRRGVDLATIAFTRDRSARILLYQATHDSLTGLPNRVHLVQQLSRTIEDNVPCALLFCDLDGFKAVNDSLGHAAGDDLLRHVAERIRECVRHEYLVSRIGGDEFVVVVENPADIAEVHSVASSIAAEIARPFAIGDTHVSISASIGIAESVGRAADVDDLLLQADMAMYRAKQAGGASWVAFTSEHESPRKTLEARAASVNLPEPP